MTEIVSIADVIRSFSFYDPCFDSESRFDGSFFYRDFKHFAESAGVNPLLSKNLRRSVRNFNMA